MMRIRFWSVAAPLVAVALGAPALAQTEKPAPPVANSATAPQPAQAVLDAATKKAAASSKTVMVLFHASW